MKKDKRNIHNHKLFIKNFFIYKYIFKNKGKRKKTDVFLFLTNFAEKRFRLINQPRSAHLVLHRK